MIEGASKWIDQREVSCLLDLKAPVKVKTEARALFFCLPAYLPANLIGSMRRGDEEKNVRYFVLCVLFI